MLDDTSLAYIDAITRGDQPEAERLGAVLDAVTLLQQQRANVDLGAAALDYARTGIAVFPCHSAADGSCSCGNSDCSSPAKHPRTPKGFKDASTDLKVIKAWWEAWPDANIGTPTGHLFDVVDIDGREGMVSMYHGADPIVNDFTVIGIAQTARNGGRHLYIPVTGRGNNTALMPGVDYRGRGGYVIAPPSVGANGNRYEWRERNIEALKVAS